MVCSQDRQPEGEGAMIEALFFYMFAGVMLAAGTMVVISRNPVYSVLFLILAFFNAAGLFVLIGAEFIAMLLVVVYVGAVAVLFLFVVMMLDINFAEMRAGFQKYLPLGLAVGGILVFELVAAVYGDAFDGVTLPAATDISNTRALGNVLYTKYIYLFQVAGLILLVAMIGAISLTMRRRVGVRRQVIAEQNMRRRDETVEVVDVPVGAAARTISTVVASKREG
jgi:NADH-quinone oxidoreductase subunit J